MRVIRSTAAVIREAWSALTISADAFYDLAEWPAQRRFGISLWIFGTLLTALFLPVAPPVDAVSPLVGWGVSAAILLVAIAITHRLVRRPGVSHGELLAGSVIAVLGIGLLAWMSGNQVYEILLVFPTTYCAIVHPPSRSIGVLGLGIGMSWLLMGQTHGPSEGDELVARTLFWISLTGMAIAYTMSVRRRRMRLVEGTEIERDRAISDVLTGLGNRRAFDDALEVELSRAERTGSPFVLMVMDLEDFKSVNDRFGHLEGDRVLREAAAVLSAQSRPPDAWFRWGGDEFCGLYPATTADEGRAPRGRLLGELAARCTRPDGKPLRAQIGIADWAPGTSAEELLAAADADALAAKREPEVRRRDSHSTEPPTSAA